MLLQGEDSALFQRSQRGGRGAGKIAKLLGGGCPQSAEELRHRVAQGSSLPSGGDQLHGLLCRHIQHGQPLCLVPHRPLGAGLQYRDLPVQKDPDGGGGVLGAKGGVDLSHVPAPPPAAEHLRQPGGSWSVREQIPDLFRLQPGD